MANIVFNTIAIFDAIPESEKNTAISLHNKLTKIAFDKAPGFQVRYFRIIEPDDIETAIAVLRRDTQNQGLRPWIHLEGHGFQNQSGFVTANSRCCTWKTLIRLLTPLNIESDFNLFLVLSTCFGGSFAGAIDPSDRSPLAGLVGPTRAITIDEIERDFPPFYQTLFDTQSIDRAFTALCAHTEPDFYYLVDAKQFFCKVWAHYKLTECTEERLDQRARELCLEELRSSGRILSPYIVKNAYRTLEESLFNEFRDRYFMYDQNKKYKERFPLTYEAAEALPQAWASNHPFLAS